MFYTAAFRAKGKMREMFLLENLFGLIYGGKEQFFWWFPMAYKEFHFDFNYQ